MLLAAGGSSRLGQAKQLATLQGETLVRRTAKMLVRLTPSVVVVTGAKQREVELELEDLPVKLVENPRWQAGVGSSIAVGIGKVPVSANAVLIMLCDQYRITRHDLRRLVVAWQAEPDHIAVARWGKQFGSPAVFPRSLFVPLSHLAGDHGARQLLVQNRSRLNFVEMPEAAYDLDDAVDLARLRRFEAKLTES
jgi:molybdenum cofactor cytidylyltransferase